MTAKLKESLWRTRLEENKENSNSIANGSHFPSGKLLHKHDKHQLHDTNKRNTSGKKNPLKKTFLKNNLEKNNDKECMLIFIL
jgi:hypothetical protein